jgi:ribosome-associated toxin RatA of RatAB toxin-antitoxin module
MNTKFGTCERFLALSVGALAALLLAPGVACSQEVTVRTTRAGDTFEIEARAVMAVARETAWQVVTDYERLPEFIPGLHTSQVLSRTANRLVLEQRGELRFLIFSVPMAVRMEVEERPLEAVLSKVVSGTVRAMHGRYDLAAVADGTEFRYRGTIVVDLGIPGFLGEVIVRSNVESQFNAMVREILRRAQAAQRIGRRDQAISP